MRTTILLLVLSCGAASATAASPKMPTFSARRDYLGLASQWVAVADTNGDGIPDLIASQQGFVEVLFGNGDGTFRPGPATLTGMSYVGSFVTIDANRDGKIDLIMAGEVEQGPTLKWGIGVSLGNGDGTFQPVVLYQAGTDSAISYLAVGDFNGDGIPDAATAGASGIWLFIGNGDGTFGPGVLVAQLSTGSGSLAATDFNADHKLDLVVTMPVGPPPGTGAGFAVLFGNGNGTFQPPQTFAEPKKPLGVAVGELTKGGYPGIALSAFGSADVYLYFGNGTGGFSAPKAVYLPAANGIAIGDVNGDGIPDLVSGGVYIALGTASGAFRKPFYYPIQGFLGTSNVVLADLRNDGLTDIVTDAHSGISVLLSQGKGKYEDGQWTKVSGGATCGATADFNGDGKPDLAVNTPQASPSCWEPATPNRPSLPALPSL